MKTIGLFIEVTTEETLATVIEKAILKYRWFKKQPEFVAIQRDNEKALACSPLKLEEDEKIARLRNWIRTGKTVRQMAFYMNVEVSEVLSLIAENSLPAPRKRK